MYPTLFPMKSVAFSAPPLLAEAPLIEALLILNRARKAFSLGLNFHDENSS